jgi:hypothetical protein
MVCSFWLRFEDCPVKKCRHLHDLDSNGYVAKLRNIQTPVLTTCEAEPACFPVPLRDVLPRDWKNVLFVSVDGLCVFDRNIPHIWLEWLEQRTVAQRAVALNTIIESDDEDIENSDVEYEKISCHARATSPRQDESLGHIALALSTFRVRSLNEEATSGSTSFWHLNKLLLSAVFTWCVGTDLLNLMCVSRELKHVILRDSAVRGRHKTASAIIAAEGKQRKDEARKKTAKSAHCKKTGKKDGFARGGHGGQQR